MNEQTSDTTKRNACQAVPLRTTFYPDINFIRKSIPVQDIAVELGLRVNGHYRAHCWRMDAHRNADSDPSIGFDRRHNKGICFVCDSHAWSNLDLVAMVLSCSIREAVEWIASRFPVPMTPRRKHIVKRCGWEPVYRVGTTGSVFEWLVRSGFWASLTPTQRSVLVVLQVFADSETGTTQISFRGIMRFAGIGSASSVAKAVKRFRRLHVLDLEGRNGSDGFRTCNRYRLTFDDAKFLTSLNETYRRQEEEIFLERGFRAEERNRRRRQKASATSVQVDPLSTGWTTGKSNATPDGA
jgi:hypothetical protein